MDQVIKILLMIMLISCSDRPSREKFPGGEGKTVGLQSGGTTQAVLGGFDPMAQSVPVDDGDATASNGNDKGKSSGVVKGVLRLAEGLNIDSSAVIFLSLRPMSGGRPLAVKKLAAVGFPIKFQLSDADAMVAGTKLKGRVEFKARIDHDGDAWSSNDNDIEVIQEVEVGGQALDILFK